MGPKPWSALIYTWITLLTERFYWFFQEKAFSKILMLKYHKISDKTYSESSKSPELLFLKKRMNRELWVIQNLNCYVIATGMIFVLFC